VTAEEEYGIYNIEQRKEGNYSPSLPAYKVASNGLVTGRLKKDQRRSFT